MQMELHLNIRIERTLAYGLSRNGIFQIFYPSLTVFVSNRLLEFYRSTINVAMSVKHYKVTCSVRDCKPKVHTLRFDDVIMKYN